MVKINKEEYKYLKNLDDKWEWIARNRDGGVYKFQEPPEKVDNFRWNDSKHPWLGVYGNRFSFIQWEDENPYNIAELIAEYEWVTALRSVLYGESEETEVKEEKKDIEWVKNQIELRDTGTTDTEDPQFYVNMGLKMALDFLDQIDELVPKQEALE